MLLSSAPCIALKCFVLTLWLEIPLSLLALPLNQHCSLYSGAQNIECLTHSNIGPQLRDSPTLWFIEFYSSSCGHCISFAPKYQKLSDQIKYWHFFVKLAVLDCSPSINRETCREFKVHAFPSFNWQPPLSDVAGNKVSIPRRDVPTLTNIIIDLIIENRHKYSEHLSQYIQQLLDTVHCDTQLDTLLEDNATASLILIVENGGSYIGKQILLDVAENMLGRTDLMIRRLEVPEGADCPLLPSPMAQSELPQLVFFEGSSTVLQYKSRVDGVRTHYSAVISHLVTSSQDIALLSESELEELVMQMPKGAIAEESGADLSEAQGEVVFNRIRHGFTVSDLINAVSYSLRSEVSLKEEIAGDDIPAIIAYLELLQHFLPQVHYKTHSSLSSLIEKLSVFKSSPNHVVSHSVTGRHWDLMMLEKLDSSVFPVNPRWVGCRGTKPYLRGYTCGVWVLFHVFLTHAALESAEKSEEERAGMLNSVKVAIIFRDYVVRFFSCADCKIHFKKMSKHLEKDIHTDREAVLWFWSAHNKINERLKDDPSVDSTAPKVQFPSQELCPNCRFTSPILNPSHEVFSLHGVTWNTTEVYHFLLRYYNRQRKAETISNEIEDRHMLPVCYIVYGFVGLLLLMLVRRIYRRRRKIMNRFKQF